ncbi:MAG: histidine phosphatase family protein [Clostridia bacterium]|nr:histidine phosphatase family protein [Clostridia bacterium]
MTKVYLIRHCQPVADESNGDAARPLTEKGYADVPKVTEYFMQRQIDAVYCSPYRRSIETISEYCQKSGHDLNIVQDFREVRLGKDYQGEFVEMIKRRWNDFNYNLSDGESYAAVQKRCIEALIPLLEKHEGGTIAVSMHSTAMSTMINYYKPDFVWENYFEVLMHTPYIALLTIDDGKLVDIQYHHFD